MVKLQSEASKKLNLFEARHLETLRASLLPKFQVVNQVDWIKKNTRIKGKPYSFKGREYQATILNDPTKDIYVKKCSQVGLSELCVRRILSFLQMHLEVTAIYILPTASFSETFSRTRLSTVIDASPNLEGIIKPGNDNAKLKIFNNGSQIHFKGASTNDSAISIPADSLIFDEKDFFERQDIQTQYTSRLTASKFKHVFVLSTPTLPGRGISADFDVSMQHVELQKCTACNHWFEPDYFLDVRLPGFNCKMPKGKAVNDLRELNFQTRGLIDKYDLTQAYLACRKCGKKVDTDIKNRTWVVKNNEAVFSPHGYHIKPFSCPSFITMGDLIHTSGKYKRFADFVNFELGENHSSADAGLTEEELAKIFLPPTGALVTHSVMGVDLGGICHFTIAQPAPDGQSFRVIHTECVSLRDLETRYFELCAKYRVICTVMDSLPYTTDVIRMQSRDPNLWGAVFTSSTKVELYIPHEQEKDPDRATFGMKQIDISRDNTLSFVTDMIRAGNITYTDSPLSLLITQHLCDLKRVTSQNKYGEDIFVYKKSSKGEDHFFLSLLYCTVAFFLKGTSKHCGALPSLCHTIKLKN